MAKSTKLKHGTKLGRTRCYTYTHLRDDHRRNLERHHEQRSHRPTAQPSEGREEPRAQRGGVRVLIRVHDAH